MSKNDTPKSFRFSPEELAELEAAAKKSGSYKAAIMAGIRSVNGGNAALSSAVAAELRRIADQIEPTKAMKGKAR